jgi:hypothetical protein
MYNKQEPGVVWFKWEGCNFLDVNTKEMERVKQINGSDSGKAKER